MIIKVHKNLLPAILNFAVYFKVLIRAQILPQNSKCLVGKSGSNENFLTCLVFKNYLKYLWVNAIC